jgi:hypothetical protein
MNKNMTDLLLVLALLAAIGFLVFLQLRDEGKLELLNPTATEEAAPASRPTNTLAPILFSPTAPTQTLVRTRTATVTSSPSPTPKVTSTATSAATLTLTPIANKTQWPVDEEIRLGIERGNTVVQAIETYNQNQGFYPAVLGDLVPAYLPEIPVTISGQQFFYRVFERTTVMSPEIYWVAFKVVSQNHLTCTYFRRLEYWDCNYASP